MVKKNTASSQPEKLVQVNASVMRKPLTKKQQQEIAQLTAMPDSAIDFSDIPETVGTLYRPIKRAISIRVDSDVLAWLKSKGHGHLSRINEILRQQMIAELKR
jgi:uncharacterized protein (DUF4415 family)